MKSTILLLMCLVCGSTASGSDDPGTLLRGARSLRCTFTSSVNTWVRSGHRTIENTTEKSTAVYDNIDIIKGTARIVGNIGAADVFVRFDQRPGNLWIEEITPSGNEVVTVVFPAYAEGTKEFVVLETRHSMVGQIILGQESFGTCQILE
jgi:hypothetical protein